MSPRAIHVTAMLQPVSEFPSFLRLNNIPSYINDVCICIRVCLCVCIKHILFILLCISGHRDCFSLWAFVPILTFCYWNVTVLLFKCASVQGGVSFWCTAARGSCVCSRISSFSPLRFIAGYWIFFPWLYSRSWLIYLIYNSLCLLIPNS